MGIDEQAKEQQPTPSNVRQLIPRSVGPAPKTEQDFPLAQDRNVIDDEDDPGPSAA
jgi:hypothetical protein